jgi:hypothetical protein
MEVKGYALLYSVEGDDGEDTEMDVSPATSES